MAGLSPSFTCSLNPQYINVFQRSIPGSVTIVLCTLNIASAIIAILLNLLVIVSIITTPKLRTPTFLLLCNLALTDLIIGLLIGSTEVGYLIMRALGQYDVFCQTWKILVVLSYFLCPASLYTITAISYDRYLSLLMKMKYKTVVTKKKAFVTIVLLWVWSAMGIATISVLGKKPFLILVCCVTFFCLVVIIDCYLLSFAAISKHQKDIRSSTLTNKSKSKFQKSIRTNKGRKGIKRPVESFGHEYEERKRFAKSCDIDAIGQYESRDVCTESADVIGQKDSEDEGEDFGNEDSEDLDSGNDDSDATRSQNENSQSCSAVQKVEEDFGKCKERSSSVHRMSQLDNEKVRNTLDPTKTEYIFVKKDIESVIEKVEIEGENVSKTAREDGRNQLKHPDDKFEQKPNPHSKNNRQESVNSKLTIQKAQLLADAKKFKQTLHTILIIVVALFLCYLPYLIVSTLVTLGFVDIGIAWDLAAITVYVNSSISPVVMCTRIASIRAAGRRLLKRLFCQH